MCDKKYLSYKICNYSLKFYKKHPLQLSNFQTAQKSLKFVSRLNKARDLIPEVNERLPDTPCIKKTC